MQGLSTSRSAAPSTTQTPSRARPSTKDPEAGRRRGRRTSGRGCRRTGCSRLQVRGAACGGARRERRGPQVCHGKGGLAWRPAGVCIRQPRRKGGHSSCRYALQLTRLRAVPNNVVWIICIGGFPNPTPSQHDRYMRGRPARAAAGVPAAGYPPAALLALACGVCAGVLLVVNVLGKLGAAPAN